MCTVVEVGIRLYFIRVFDKVDFMIILKVFVFILYEKNHVTICLQIDGNNV